jgi:putative NADPH-quinone reductase
MAKLLVYYAHPGHRYSRVNKEMASVAENHSDITFCDLYKEYPRYNIDIDAEQEKLLNHDVILFQHPLFWYSTPSLIKEWIDLVLEHGFAFGSGGDKLTGKIVMNAISAAGPENAYTPQGYQHYPLRTFLTPMEQTARLCHMKYAAPYVLYSSLNVSEDSEIPKHVQGYRDLLTSISEDRYDFDKAINQDVITSETIHQFTGSSQ